MSLLKQREEAVAAALEIKARVEAEDRELTDEEIAVISEKASEVEALDARIKAADDAAAKLKALGAPVARKENPVTEVKEDAPARSLGEHFVKHAGAQLVALKGVKGAAVSAPEFKAYNDAHTVTETGDTYKPWLTEFDRNPVPTVKPRLFLADLLGSGSLSGNAVQYFLEDDSVDVNTGQDPLGYGFVAEGGAKPQMHFNYPTPVTDTLKKIAGWIQLSDEMIEDLDFVVSEINGRLLDKLRRFEEAALLNGPGTGASLLGLRGRGISDLSVDGDDSVADTLFKAINKVSLESGLEADALVINPADYQALRLAKDGNDQYYGGGYFQGQYGNGGIQENPPVWGLRTVVTPAIEAGVALVGNFKSATVYRKGGVRVESTNSHGTTFTDNIVTVRAEERLALAVRRPKAFVEVDLVGQS